MRIVKKMSVILCALCLGAVASHAETVSFDFIDHDAFAGLVNGASNVVATGISGTANGEAFTFDATFTTVNGQGGNTFRVNNRGILFNMDPASDMAQSVTVTVSNFSGVSGQTYGGIAAVKKYDNPTGGSDSWDIAGQIIDTTDTSNTELTSPILGAMTINGIDRGAGTNDNSKLLGFSISVINDAGYTLIYSAGMNGTITGTTTQTVDHAASGSEVEAVPDTGYFFLDWSDGSTENPRTDLDVTEDLSVTANFESAFKTLIYVAGENGTISGTTSQTVAYAANGSEVEAVPDTGYFFVDWSDGSTQNPRTDLDVVSNLTVTANFAVAGVEIVNFMFQSNAVFDVFVDGTGPITATGVTGIANGEAFTFDVTVSAVSGNGDGHIDFNNRDIMFDADSGQNRANSLTLTISNMQFAAGQTYGGIVGVNKYDFQGGDDWDIAGQTISGTNATYTTLTNPILGAMTINTIDNAPGANKASKLQGFSISVSTDGALKEVGTITVGGTATLPGGGEGLILSWTGFSGQNYSVESRADLTSGAWEPYTNAIGVYTNIPGIDGSMAVTTAVDKVEEFYQVIAE